MIENGDPGIFASEICIRVTVLFFGRTVDQCGIFLKPLKTVNREKLVTLIVSQPGIIASIIRNIRENNGFRRLQQRFAVSENHADDIAVAAIGAFVIPVVVGFIKVVDVVFRAVERQCSVAVSLVFSFYTGISFVLSAHIAVEIYRTGAFYEIYVFLDRATGRDRFIQVCSIFADA